MRLLRDLFILWLLFLIKVGDLVLLAFDALVKNLRPLSLSKLPAILAATKRLVFGEKRKTEKSFRPLRKIRKSRPVVVFPLPFLVKFKYFFFGFIFSSLFIFTPLLIFIFIQNLPNPKSISLGEIPQTTKIYDRNGVLLHQIYATQNRTIVSLSEIPKHLQEATIAIEDKDFYNHLGFSPFAILRSAYNNFKGEGLQGGSTITQQLIKSALLTPETSIERKIKEIVLAFWAERIYTKGQILELYFNQIPYGGTAWGVGTAAQVYFGKDVGELTLAESAFLAGIPKAPTIYSPFGTSPNSWKTRQKEVLDRMVALGYISKDEALAAKGEELSFIPPQTPLRAPHFVMHVRDLLMRKYGLPMVEKGGLTVITSLDLNLNETVQRIVTEEVTNNAYLNLTNGAALVTNPKNGDILAMVGSKNYNNSNGGNVNVTTSLRQPGSAIKPVTYATALSQGLTAASILDDSPIVFTSPGAPSYAPVNYDGKFRGRVSLRIALANSLNIPAVKTLNQIGVSPMVQLAKKMGITTWKEPEQYGLAITLGAAETKMVDMATVFGVLANEGVRIDQNPILKVTNYKGEVLEEKRTDMGKERGERVLDQGIVFILSHILSDNQARALEFGINSPLNIPGKTVSVKTGTSDNKRDNWTFGYTPSYVVSVWVGNNDNSPMSQSLASGITGAAPIWNRVMNHLLKDKSDEKLNPPSNVVQKPCIGRLEYFIKGTQSSVSCAYAPPTPSPIRN